MILTLFSVGTPKACLFYREDRWKQMRRIVVTGMGAVSPLGANVDISWSRLLAGQSGIRRLTDDVVGDLPAKVGGVVPSLAEDPERGFDPDRIIAPKDQRKVDRFIIFALAAAEEALVQANWKPVSNEDRLRTATIIASGIGGFLPSRKPCEPLINAVYAASLPSRYRRSSSISQPGKSRSATVSKVRWEHP